MINLSTKPQITISLDPLLEAFCRFYFKTPEKQKEIVVSRNKDIGKLIHSNVTTSEFPVKRPLRNNPVTFILPVNKRNHYAIRFHFLTVNSWGEQKIQDGIEYEYKKWAEERFEIGYLKGYTQKQIIDAILRGLNVRNNAANFDAVKQNDYRKRKKQEEKRFIELLQIDM